jgi:ERCC4-type nuclease
MLKIIIDSRETNLYNNIIERDLDKYTDKITIIKEQLEIGDIHIQIDDLIYVYERKTVNDLLSSVKDSRYKEQKSRLLSNYKNVNYIIEGSDIIASNNKHNQNLLTSIYFNSTYRDNIKIFFTKNINDTITFILMLSTKIIDKPHNFIQNEYKKQNLIILIYAKLNQKRVII